MQVNQAKILEIKELQLDMYGRALYLFSNIYFL